MDAIGMDVQHVIMEQRLIKLQSVHLKNYIVRPLKKHNIVEIMDITIQKSGNVNGVEE